MPKRIGVDLGGSWMRVGVQDPAVDCGQLQRIDKHPSPGGWDRFVDILTHANTADVAGFGIAIAGPIDDHRRVLKGPNLPWLDGRDVAGDLAQKLGKKVVISNDMEAAAEGELARGVLKNYRWAIFDTISTGWGGNLIVNGQRVDGEPGHVHVEFDIAYPCGCGKFGCYEARYSGSALERRIVQVLQVHHSNTPHGAELWKLFDTEVANDTGWATALLDGWAEGVGRAWANVLNRLRPLEAVVYMGTTAESMLSKPRVRERLRATVQQVAMFPEHKRADFPILPAREENRGIYGALIVLDGAK